MKTPKIIAPGFLNSRRSFMGAIFGSLSLAACDSLTNSQAFTNILAKAEKVNRFVHKAVSSRHALAQEFPESYISPVFRPNGVLMPKGEEYQSLINHSFSGWRLNVRGLVRNQLDFSLAQLRALPSRTQITRHDCVEGWSCIGKWRGAPLKDIVQLAEPLPAARYAVFHCLDSQSDDEIVNPKDVQYYYESLDLDDVMHPQTILAYDLNDKPLPIANGAPLRLRVERQLGYKNAKYLKAIEFVAELGPVYGGNGGYWEDQGYAWYAGI